MTAYYNEFDPYAAQWLRNLIAAGLIAPGDVDERDLNDVHPDDLRPYTQVHLCAGIGVWSRALRNIGWPDDARIWSASFPCQPFSAAGKGMGFDDERHLWPTGYHLITHLRPKRIVGEQVASKDGLAWLDLIHSDMEAAGYTFGAVDICAAGVGSPHIRQRLYWMADTSQCGGGAFNRQSRSSSRPQEPVGRHDIFSLVGDPQRMGLEGHGGHDHGVGGRENTSGPVAPSTSLDGVAHTDQRERGWFTDGQGCEPHGTAAGWQQSNSEPQSSGADRGAGPTNGYWRDVDWLFCRDGKWRPVEPGTFPLAHAWTLGNRVGMLRAAGNAINIAQAEAFLAAALT